MKFKAFWKHFVPGGSEERPAVESGRLERIDEQLRVTQRILDRNAARLRGIDAAIAAKSGGRIDDYRPRF